jgi:hypothetical protein
LKSDGIGEFEMGEGGGEVIELEKKLESVDRFFEVEFILDILNLPKNKRLAAKAHNQNNGKYRLLGLVWLIDKASLGDKIRRYVNRHSYERFLVLGSDRVHDTN